MKITKKITTLSIIISLLFTSFTSCVSRKNQEDSRQKGPDQIGKMDRPGNPPKGRPDDNFAFGGKPGPKDMPGPDGMMGRPGMEGPDRNKKIQYAASLEITSAETQNDQTYTSSSEDECALLISTKDNVFINNPTVNKTGDSKGGDACNFYGLNASVLVKGGSKTSINGGNITSNANGANGVFSYGGNGAMNGGQGDGTTVIIKDTKIVTKGNSSGGIMTTGGGITKAYNLDITTSGRSSAAIRTDRGGGTVTVEGGTYTTNGLGSPAIYSTADITVSNANLTSNLSEGVCIEGKNSIILNNCNLTANNTQKNGKASFLDTIMIYQSMSGDADSGTSSFTMNGGKLTGKNGHIFHVTNTNAIINLDDVIIQNEDENNILLSVCDDGWSGASNKAALNAVNQKLNGSILVGKNSTFSLNLKENTVFEGSIKGSIKNADGKIISEKTGNVSVSLDESSLWILTDDTYISSFAGDLSKVNLNGHKLYINNKLVN